MDGTGTDQVIVGVSGSLASFQALRQAVHEARSRGAELTVVHAYTRRGPSWSAPIAPAGDDLVDAAFARLDGWLDEALGAPPTDLTLRKVVVQTAAPGPALLRLVRSEGDLLVLGGSGRRFDPRWVVSTAAYCGRRAACPVLVVPPSEMARELSGLRGPRWGLVERLERQLGEDLWEPGPAPRSGWSPPTSDEYF